MKYLPEGTIVEAIRDMTAHDVEDETKDFEIKAGSRGLITGIEIGWDFNDTDCYVIQCGKHDEIYMRVDKIENAFKVAR